MLFLPRGVHSECEVLPLNCFWWIGFYMALNQLTIHNSPEEAPTHMLADPYLLAMKLVIYEFELSCHLIDNRNHPGIEKMPHG